MAKYSFHCESDKREEEKQIRSIITPHLVWRGLTPFALWQRVAHHHQPMEVQTFSNLMSSRILIGAVGSEVPVDRDGNAQCGVRERARSLPRMCRCAHCPRVRGGMTSLVSFTQYVPSLSSAWLDSFFLCFFISFLLATRMVTVRIHTFDDQNV